MYRPEASWRLQGNKNKNSEVVYYANALQYLGGLDKDVLFASLSDESRYNPRDASFMKYRGNKLRRSKFFNIKRLPGDTSPADGVPDSLYVYRYTGFQWQSVLSYRHFEADKDVQSISKALDRTSFDGVPFRHTQSITTAYFSGTDVIGAHRDKCASFAENCLIIIVSLGATRTMLLRDYESKEELKSFELEAGSVLTMNLAANEEFTHEIVESKKEDVGTRISIVFRDIAEVLHSEQRQKKLEQSSKSKIKREEKKKEKLAEKRGLIAEASVVVVKKQCLAGEVGKKRKIAGEDGEDDQQKKLKIVVKD
jgi:hypothetical protein